MFCYLNTVAASDERSEAVEHGLESCPEYVEIGEELTRQGCDMCPSRRPRVVPTRHGRTPDGATSQNNALLVLMLIWVGVAVRTSQRDGI